MRIQTYLTCLILTACGTLSAQSVSHQAYRIDSVRQVHDLTPYAEIFVDLTGQIPPEEIARTGAGLAFQPLTEYSGVYRHGPNYWVHIPVTAGDNFSELWLIAWTDNPLYDRYGHWDYMEMLVVDTSGAILQRQVTGATVPRRDKSLDTHAGLTATSLALSDSSKYHIYLRFVIDFGSSNEINLRIELRNPHIGLPQNTFAQMMSVLTSVAALLGVLSLFFFLFVREKSYLYFFLYLTCLALHYLILHPYLPFANWLVPTFPIITIYAFYALANVSFILFMLFGRHFINLPRLSQRTDLMLKWFLRIWVVLLIAELIFMVRFHHFVLSPYVLALLVVIAIGFIVRFALFKNVLAYFFAAGAAWLLVFTIFGLLQDFVPAWIRFNPWPVGQVGQMLIFMIGLAYKIRLNERAKAQAERIREMDDIKSRFFANISHEFRTPLTLIRGVTQQIEKESTGNDKPVVVPLRKVNTIRRNADRLLELVNQLLDLSRLDSGKMQLQVIKGDVLQMLKAISHAFDSMAERKQIHYHMHFPEETPIGFFDKDKLEKIFTNLLGNAFKYTPEQGTVSINVEVHEQRLRITVDDSGPGIPKKELDKVFDRFYQVEGGESNGSGIGLALVKELVALYRGQISVSSEPGRGTQFRVSLPLDKNAFKENELVYGEWKSEGPVQIINSVGPDNIPVPNTASSTLPVMLVVEDNADLRNFICESVQHQYQVIEAMHGSEGLEKAISEIPDIIVSDVMMPQMDGFALTEKLKKDERTSHIPVILLTAKAGQLHKIAGLETGADDYLTKPFDEHELLVRAQNLINQRKQLRKKFAGQIRVKPSEVAVNSVDEQFLTRAMAIIEKRMEEELFGVEEFAREMAMSRSQLHRKLVALIDKSPSELLRQTRLLRAKELLVKKAGTPSEIAFQVGFNSHSYFSKCFRDEFGVSPSEV